MTTEIELRRDSGLEAARPGEVTLAGAVRLVLPPPAPGERYHLRGLTELWAQKGAGRESEHTRRSYETGLAQWLDYCLRNRVNPLQTRLADADDWVATHLNSKNPQTINARLAAVGSWYGYLLDNDIDARDPTARVKRPKRQRAKSKTPHLDEGELNALMATADRRLEDAKQVGGLTLEIAARDVAVLRTLYTTAVRSGAVQLATVADVRLVEDGHRVLRFHGKGDGGETVDRLKPLVPYAAAADITPAKIAKLSPHSLRHTAATLLGRTKTLAEVQDFLDHADPRTTRPTCTPTSPSTPRWPTAPPRSSTYRLFRPPEHRRGHQNGSQTGSADGPYLASLCGRFSTNFAHNAAQSASVDGH